MIFALLAVLIIGLALYETGYGVTNTLFKSLRKQAVVQISAVASFLVSMHFWWPAQIADINTLSVTVGFLSMLAYISTCSIRECHLTALASSAVGALLFPLILHFTQTYFNAINFVDTAGAGLVHFVGGTIALVTGFYTTKVMRKDQGIVIRPISATVGFLILLVGWIAYVGLISAPVLQSGVETWIKGLVNMSTATAWGAVAAVIYMLLARGHVKMRTCTVGGLAGMVAMSADPFSAPFWVAALIGSLGGLAAVMTYGLMCRFKIVDQSNTVSIHLLPGLIGVLSVPFVNSAAFFASQITGLALLVILAISMGVAVCEIHNLSKTSYRSHS